MKSINFVNYFFFEALIFDITTKKSFTEMIMLIFTVCANEWMIFGTLRKFVNFYPNFFADRAAQKLCARFETFKQFQTVEISFKQIFRLFFYSKILKI